MRREGAGVLLANAQSDHTYTKTRHCYFAVAFRGTAR
jgi:hypothetical protein